MGQQDAEFVDRVEAPDIEFGIAFSKTQLLGQRQGLFEFQLVFLDPGEDIVGGTIDDATDRFQQVVIVVLFEIAYDGHTGAAGRFVKEGGFVPLLQCEQFLEMFRDHFLVGAHDGLAFLQGGFHDPVRRVGIVDEFNDHVDAFVVEQGGGISGEMLRRDAAFFLRVFYADLFDRGAERGRTVEYIIESFTHHAKAEEPDGEFIR